MIVVGIALAGCGSSSTTGARTGGSATGVPLTAGVPASSTAPATSPSAAPSAPAVAKEPGGSTRLLPGNRIVAFYGASATPALGVLGTASAEGIWPRLAQQAAAYKTAGAPVIPAYELITDVIQSAPGVDGDYSVQVDDTVIGSYVAAATKHGALLILDIQPGRTSFLPLAQKLARYLALPNVALALDPEWRLAPGQAPAQQIGSVSAAEVNATSAWLEQLTVAHHLPQKMLLIHQFQDGELAAKNTLAVRPHLATVVNMDGFGGRAAKLSKYRDLAADKRFGLGLKLFYQQDVGIFMPSEVLALTPAPNVVDYQ